MTTERPTREQERAAVGDEIRRMRDAAGWSQEQLAEVWRDGRGKRYTQGHFSLIESGRRPIFLDRWCDLCAIFKVDPAEALRRALERAKVAREEEDDEVK